MRFARALLASLGAGTCLVLAGTLAMATLSTVVAFSGLPGLRSGTAATPPAILAAAGPSAGSADVVPVALARPAVPSRTTATPVGGASAPRVTAAAAVAAAQTAGSVVPQGGPNTTTPTPTPSAASGGGSGSLPQAVTPPAKTRPSPAVTAPSGGPIRDVGTTAGGIVAGVGGGLAETVRPISPPVATIVGDTTKAAGDTVEGATGTVAR